MKKVMTAMVELLKVKSLVTIVLTAVFAYLSIKGTVSGEQFLTVFSMVMAFYFGIQHEKKSKQEGDDV